MKKKLIIPLIAITAATTPVMAETTEISEQVLYDENGIKVTATGFDDSGIFGPEVKVLIENNTDKSFTLQTRYSSINGFMSDFQISADVAPGKKTNDSFSIMRSDLEKNGIEQVANIDCSLHIFDSESWDTIVDTPIIPIQTNLSGNFDQAYDDSGTVMYDENGIRIISQGISEDDIWGPEPVLYIENNTDRIITVQTRDTSVNGFMVDASFSPEIAPGKKCIDGLTLFPNDLEENGITDISDLETSFHIFDSESWETITETPAVSINF